MDLGIRGQVAMVAGASRGMGRACALGLAREGVRVSICSRSAADLAAAARDIAEQTGSEVLDVPTDVSRPAEIEAWAASTIQRFGGVDILVTNAGGPPVGNWDDFLTDEPWQQAFELNLMSTIRMIRAVLPSMKARGGGRILNIQSTSVKAPIPSLILSNTIRPGVVGLAKSLSRELAEHNILINTVAPGRINTDRLRNSTITRAERLGISVEEEIAERTKEIPLRRFGTPEEFANVVVFLASGCASYVTGSTIAVDGGVLQGLW